jgi:hypothetical protein
VTGSLDDPAVSVDWEELLKSEAAGLLLDKLGLGTQSESTDATDENPDGTDQQEEKSSEDQAVEAAGALFNLLKKKDKKKDEEKEDSGGS